MGSLFNHLSLCCTHFVLRTYRMCMFGVVVENTFSGEKEAFFLNLLGNCCYTLSFLLCPDLNHKNLYVCYFFQEIYSDQVYDEPVYPFEIKTFVIFHRCVLTEEEPFAGPDGIPSCIFINSLLSHEQISVSLSTGALFLMSFSTVIL